MILRVCKEDEKLRQPFLCSLSPPGDCPELLAPRIKNVIKNACFLKLQT